MAAAQNKIHFPHSQKESNRAGRHQTRRCDVTTQVPHGQPLLTGWKKMNFIHGSKMFIYSYSLVVIIPTRVSTLFTVILKSRSIFHIETCLGGHSINFLIFS